MSSSVLPPYDRTSTFKYTEPPNTQWKYGESVDTTDTGKEWLEGEKEGWRHVDTATEHPMYVPHFDPMGHEFM
jgi:hypothetical protein